jgi:hypothetical protein
MRIRGTPPLTILRTAMPDNAADFRNLLLSIPIAFSFRATLKIARHAS